MIITPDEVKNSTRPIARNIDDKRIIVFIDETEQMDLRPVIGDELFIEVSNPKNRQKFETLLNGGEYTTKSGDVRFFKGLKSALNYYVYARFTKNNNIIIARNANLKKEGEYSSPATAKEVLDSYADAFLIADSYLKDVVLYISENKDLFPSYNKGQVNINRVRYRIIGE